VDFGQTLLWIVYSKQTQAESNKIIHTAAVPWCSCVNIMEQLQC